MEVAACRVWLWFHMSQKIQEWVGLDIFKKVWIRLLKIYDDLTGIKWTWQSLDSVSIKSPLGGAMTGNNPTDRRKLGTKRHILTDAKGIPLSVVISSASTHDIKLVTDVVDNAIIKRSSSSSSLTKRNLSRKRKLQHLCLDKAYNSKTAKQEIISRGYVPHLPYRRKRGEVKTETQKMPNRKRHHASRRLG